ncbi:MAG: hypothetical protein ACRD1F_02725 [Terriglobales bacterium]
MSDDVLLRQMRHLRLYTAGTTVLAVVALIGAIGAIQTARNGSFNTITAHKLILRDQEGKLAMVFTNHDEPMPGIIAGQKFHREGGGGNEIIFYNRLGNEQGGLLWEGQRARSGGYHSGNTLSYDSVVSDQMLQVDDGNDNGKTYSYITGWNEPNFFKPRYQKMFHALAAARTAAERARIAQQYPDYRKAVVRRYVVGYTRDNNAIVMLADAQGHPRIKMFVTPSGEAELQFLDARGMVVDQYPRL